MSPVIPAIKLLLPSHQRESDQSILIRHYAALEVLCYLDENKVPWTQQMGIVFEQYDGLKTLMRYIELENPKQEWQKKQACQVLGMMVEEANPNLTKEVSLHLNRSSLTSRSSEEMTALTSLYYSSVCCIRTSISNERQQRLYPSCSRRSRPERTSE